MAFLLHDSWNCKPLRSENATLSNSIVLFDVSTVFSRRQFHHGIIIGHTQNTVPIG